MYKIPSNSSIEKEYDWILVRVLTEALRREAQKTLTSGMKAFNLGEVSREEIGQHIFEGISKKHFVKEAMSLIANWVRANPHQISLMLEDETRKLVEAYKDIRACFTVAEQHKDQLNQFGWKSLQGMRDDCEKATIEIMELLDAVETKLKELLDHASVDVDMFDPEVSGIEMDSYAEESE